MSKILIITVNRRYRGILQRELEDKNEVVFAQEPRHELFDLLICDEVSFLRNRVFIEEQRLVAEKPALSVIVIVRKRSFLIFSKENKNLIDEIIETPIFCPLIKIRVENALLLSKVKHNMEFHNPMLWSILDNIPKIITIKDAKEGTYIGGNRYLETHLGLSRHSIVGKTPMELFESECAKKMVEDDNLLCRSCQPLEIPREELQDAYGRAKTLSTIKYPIMDHTGKIRYILGVSDEYNGESI